MLRFPAYVVLASIMVLCPGEFEQEPRDGKGEELEPYLDVEAYRVYGALLPQPVPPRFLVILNETSRAYADSDDCLPHGDEFLKSWGDVVENYRMENRQRRKLLPISPVIEPSYRLYSRSKLPDSPRTHREFSSVGFNHDKTRALVFLWRYCGLLCGDGNFYFLEKKDNEWQEAEIPEGTTACSIAS
jgi:hypothetical protein